MRRILVAQIGGRRHYAVPRAIHEAGKLERLVTDVALVSNSVRRVAGVFSKFQKVRSLLGRNPGLPPNRVRCTSGVVSVARRKRTHGDDRFAAWVMQNRDFGNAVVTEGFEDADAVYTFNGAGLEILNAAEKAGLTRILDQTSASLRHDIKLLTEEFERWPGWENENAYSTAGAHEMAEREEEEWSLADVIVCGSEYVVSTLPEKHRPKCRVVPYGHGEASQESVEKKHNGHESLHVLMAGTLQLRKGVQYIVEACRKLKTPGIEFRLAGSSWLANEAAEQLASVTEIRGMVPREEMEEQYAWADVLLLPTLSEGSANVCHEALARGVPVITTPNAGSVVEDGQSGFVVPVRNSQAIADRLDRLRSDPALWNQLSVGARRRSREFSFSRYQSTLMDALSALPSKVKR